MYNSPPECNKNNNMIPLLFKNYMSRANAIKKQDNNIPI